MILVHESMVVLVCFELQILHLILDLMRDFDVNVLEVLQGVDLWFYYRFSYMISSLQKGV